MILFLENENSDKTVHSVLNPDFALHVSMYN